MFSLWFNLQKMCQIAIKSAFKQIEKVEDSDLALSFEDKMRSKVKILSEIKQVMFLKNHSDENAMNGSKFCCQNSNFCIGE